MTEVDRVGVNRLDRSVGALIVTVTLLPIVGAYASIRTGWRPAGDEATIVLRSISSLTDRPPLVGMPTTLSNFAGTPLSHPGPLQFWFSAIPVRLFGVSGAGLLIATAVVSSLALATLTWAAYRQGGRSALLVVVVAMTAPAFVLGSSVGVAPQNPFAVVFPFAAFVFCCWAVVRSDHWFLVPLVFFGSCAAQAHLTYAMAVSIAGVGVGGWYGWALWKRRGDIGEGSRRPRQALVAALITGVLSWSGPIVDQIWGSGNLGKLLRGGDTVTRHRTLGDAIRRVAGLALASPDWLRPYVPVPEPLTTAELACVIAFFALLILGTVSAIRRRDARLVALTAIVAVVLIAAIVVETRLPAVTPENGVFAATPFVGWYVIGPTLWFLLIWSTWRMLDSVFRTRGVPTASLSGGVTVAFTVGMLVLLAVNSTIVTAKDTIGSYWYGEVEYFAQHLRSIEDGNGILVTRCDGLAEDVKASSPWAYSWASRCGSMPWSHRLRIRRSRRRVTSRFTS